MVFKIALALYFPFSFMISAIANLPSHKAPGFKRSVSPIVSIPKASWICPDTARIGFFSSINLRISFEPT